MKIISMLPWADWLALSAFFSLWVGYAGFARLGSQREQTLLASTNRLRVQWMLQATARDPRMLDGLITQNLSSTPSFFFLDLHHHHRRSVRALGHHRQGGRAGA